MFISIHHIYRNLLCLAFLWQTSLVYGQLQVKIKWVDKRPLTIDKMLDTVRVEEAYQADSIFFQLQKALHIQGYITTSIDSLYTHDSCRWAHIFVGEKYFWQQLNVDDSIRSFLSDRGLQETWIRHLPATEQGIRIMVDSVQYIYINEGFPFVKTYFKNTQITEKGGIIATLSVEKSWHYLFDSIIVVGNASISPQFLFKYLQIKPKDIYSPLKLRTIDEKLSQLAFIQQYKEWEVKMTASGAVLILYLEKKSVNEVDAIIGLAPNKTTGKGVSLTGEVRLDLKNVFNNGEKILFNWQQLQPLSPRLKIAFDKPYLFKKNIGATFAFDVYKLDSSYVNINALLGVAYNWHMRHTVRFQTLIFSTRTLSTNLDYVIRHKKLPQHIDATAYSWGLVYGYKKNNYILNPTKGIDAHFSVHIGKKNIQKNNLILQIQDKHFDYNSLYDNLDIQSWQYRLESSIKQYIPLLRHQAVLKLSIDANAFFSPSAFMNELYQIGGNKLLRGFHEGSIFANHFAVGTVEGRLLLNKHSYFFSFADVASTRLKTIDFHKNNHYLSTGIGLVLETKTGLINLTLANGMSNEQPFEWKQTKVHIGFTTLF